MLKKIGLAIAAYIPCWVAAHCIVMLLRGDGFSLEYLIRYFILAWSFSAGELPSYIWLFSLLIYSAVLISWLVVSRRGRESAA